MNTGWRWSGIVTCWSTGPSLSLSGLLPRRLGGLFLFKNLVVVVRMYTHVHNMEMDTKQPAKLQTISAETAYWHVSSWDCSEMSAWDEGW